MKYIFIVLLLSIFHANAKSTKNETVKELLNFSYENKTTDKILKTLNNLLQELKTVEISNFSYENKAKNKFLLKELNRTLQEIETIEFDKTDVVIIETMLQAIELILLKKIDTIENLKTIEKPNSF